MSSCNDPRGKEVVTKHLKNSKLNLQKLNLFNGQLIRILCNQSYIHKYLVTNILLN